MNYYDEIYEYGYSSQDDPEEICEDEIALTPEELALLIAMEPPF